MENLPYRSAVFALGRRAEHRRADRHPNASGGRPAPFAARDRFFADTPVKVWIES
jgi:hypothetical protein